MNLEGKQIHIERLAINSLQREATALVHIYTPISESVRALDGSFEVRVEGEFLGPQDPALMAEIVQKLA
jgi:hypothetical protein